MCKSFRIDSKIDLIYEVIINLGVCMSALCGLRFTDFGRVAFSCKQRFQFISISPDKATKQSRDLSVCVYVIQFTVKHKQHFEAKGMFCKS